MTKCPLSTTSISIRSLPALLLFSCTIPRGSAAIRPGYDVRDFQSHVNFQVYERSKDKQLKYLAQGFNMRTYDEKNTLLSCLQCDI